MGQFSLGLCTIGMLMVHELHPATTPMHCLPNPILHEDYLVLIASMDCSWTDIGRDEACVICLPLIRVLLIAKQQYGIKHVCADMGVMFLGKC